MAAFSKPLIAKRWPAAFHLKRLGKGGQHRARSLSPSNDCGG